MLRLLPLYACNSINIIVFHFLCVVNMLSVFAIDTHENTAISFRKRAIEIFIISINTCWGPCSTQRMSFACVHWALQTIHDSIHIPFYVGMYLKWLMTYHHLPSARRPYWRNRSIFLHIPTIRQRIVNRHPFRCIHTDMIAISIGMPILTMHTKDA